MIQALQNVDFLSQIFEVLLRLAVLDNELERDDLPAVFASALRCRRGGGKTSASGEQSEGCITPRV